MKKMPSLPGFVEPKFYGQEHILFGFSEPFPQAAPPTAQESVSIPDTWATTKR